MQSFMLYNTSKKNNQKSSADDLHLYLKWHSFTVFFSNILLVQTNYLVNLIRECNICKVSLSFDSQKVF